jgi:hypothetical protein
MSLFLYYYGFIFLELLILSLCHQSYFMIHAIKLQVMLQLRYFSCNWFFHVQVRLQIGTVHLDSYICFMLASGESQYRLQLGCDDVSLMSFKLVLSRLSPRHTLIFCIGWVMTFLFGGGGREGGWWHSILLSQELRSRLVGRSPFLAPEGLALGIHDG